MKILYGTTNQGKLLAMKKSTEGLEIEVIGLHDVEGELPTVNENGKTPLENAEIKARAYFEAFHIPVFSCDTDDEAQIALCHAGVELFKFVSEVFEFFERGLEFMETHKGTFFGLFGISRGDLGVSHGGLIEFIEHGAVGAEHLERFAQSQPFFVTLFAFGKT